MSECKYSYSFNNEINALEKSNNALDASAKIPKTIPGLAAAKKFYSEHVAISRLLEVYRLLLQKDVEDLRRVMINVSETDEKLAEAINKVDSSY